MSIKKERSVESYINQYGESEGVKKYEEYKVRRVKRIARTEANTSKVKEVYTEADVENGDAIKCLACDAITSRLQWTHFKHRCIDDITSIKEYKLRFPDAETVAPNLKKETAVTLEKLVKLYGVEEGTMKWDHYRDLQAISNTFEYKSQEHGWSIEEFEAYNQSRAVTLENLIERHGEEVGLIIWEEYCEKQRYTTTIEYFIDEYGVEDGTAKFLAFDQARASSNNPHNKYSTLELEVYNRLVEEVDSSMVHQLTVLHTKGGPFDMGSTDRMKLIEVYGTYWHQDPRKYKETDRIRSNGITAKEKWDGDSQKRESAIALGYEVYVIWEADWKKDRHKVITDLITWWNNEN